MLYQLPNGRTIQMSIETYLSLSDEELNNLAYSNYGREINNPLFNSSLKDEEEILDNDPYIEDLDENVLDIPDTPTEE